MLTSFFSEMKRKIKSLINRVFILKDCQSMKEQNRFVLYELQRMHKENRYRLLGDLDLGKTEKRQTLDSFDYQWHDFHEGVGMTNDRLFMDKIESQICEMTGLPAEWFPEKRVVDIGCGTGRFTYGLLSLGSSVTACDQSEGALKRTSELCKGFSDRLITRKIDLLEWDERGNFDLGFCFGVVHHTGNPYLAIRNVSLKVKPGGRLFLMVYGFPETLTDFMEINAYEELRGRLGLLSFEERKEWLIQQLGRQHAHGWFDAVSPSINDLLTFQEIAELLRNLGFQNIFRTRDNRNHHLVAEKREGSEEGNSQGGH